MPKTTPLEYVYYALQLYCSGLSLRKTSERLSSLIKRNHVSVWNWIQKYRPKKILKERKTIAEFIVDETLIKVGNQYAWLWVAIEPVNKVIIVGIRIPFRRNMLIGCLDLRITSGLYTRFNMAL
jgi:putative transposase